MTDERPRWRQQLFHTWQPVEQSDGSWEVCLERPAQNPIRFVDQSDREVGHTMGEDEALDRARALNAIGWEGTSDPRYPKWSVE